VEFLSSTCSLSAGRGQLCLLSDVNFLSSVFSVTCPILVPPFLSLNLWAFLQDGLMFEGLLALLHVFSSKKQRQDIFGYSLLLFSSFLLFFSPFSVT
jgi:hypothetical protein